MKPDPDNISDKYLIMVNLPNTKQAAKQDDSTPAQLITNFLYTDPHIQDVKFHKTLISLGFSIITASYPAPLPVHRSDHHKTAMVDINKGQIQ